MKNFRVAIIVLLVVGICASGLWAAQKPRKAPPVRMGVEEVFDKMECNVSDPNAQIRFLPENVKSWYARWYIMDNAKKSIDTTYFIVEQDIFGMSMLGMLMKKAREGVNIRILLDARGTKGLTRKFLGQDVMQELAKFKNVQIKVFNPVSFNLLRAFEDIRNIVASNHDKIIVVDQEYLITGGRNISKSYFVDPADIPTVYRDTDIVIKSPIVAKQAQQAFEEEFNPQSNFNVTSDLLGNVDAMHADLDIAYQAMRRFMLGGGLYKIDPKKTKLSQATIQLLETYNKELSGYSKLTDYSSFRLFQGERSYPTRILDKNSRKGFRNDITFNLTALMNAAQKEIIIQNPYVVLTPETEAAIARASKRGVKVIIQTNSPMSSDSLLTQAMFIGDWQKILKENQNVRIFAYKLSSKLHSKVFVFDRKIAVIGTYNMDYLSEQVNSEEVAVVKSGPFATQVALRIEQDMRDSHEYKIEVTPAGEVKTVFGPETHSDPKVIGRLKLLLKLNWLRPLI
jgi:phosphatidylserine/phosphatidylglycerophosphate/cardiolipin synthase-like enzyme